MSDIIFSKFRGVTILERSLQSRKPESRATGLIEPEKANPFLLFFSIPNGLPHVHAISFRPSNRPSRSRDPQHKIDHHGPSKDHRQHSRTEPVVKPPLPSQPYTLRPPVEGNKGIDHAPHCHNGEKPGADAGRGIGAKVQQADRETAEDDCEIEPGEEGALICEEDFGLDPGGEGDAFARGGLEEGLR